MGRKLALLVAVLCVPAIAALVMPGTISGFDIQYHTVALAQFWPSFNGWAPDMAGGYGYPNFVFYPPGTYLLASLPLLAGASYAQALDITIAFAFIGGALSMYALGTVLWGRVAGVVAAVAYTYAPYHLVTAYAKGAVPELVAVAMWPLAVLFLVRLRRDSRLTDALAFAVIFAATILCNSLAGMLLAGICVLFAATAGVRFLPLFAVGFVGGLALSAFFWLPALVESSATQAGVMTGGYFRFDRHFVTLAQLVYSPQGFAPSGFPGQFSRMLGCVQLAGLIVAVAAFQRATDRRTHAFLLALAIVSCLLTTAASAPLWRAVGLLQTLQFPWRFLAPAMFAGSLLAGWAVSLLTSDRQKVAAIAAVVASILLGVPHARPWQQLQMGDFGSPADVADITHRSIVGAQIVHVYSSFLPAEATVPPEPRTAAAEGDGFTLEHGTPRHMVVSSERGGTLTLQTFYFPGWRVLVDGRHVETKASEPYGLIAVRVPPGRHVVEARFTRTPVRWWGLMLSLWALVSMLLVAWRYHPAPCSPPASPGATSAAA